MIFRVLYSDRDLLSEKALPKNIRSKIIKQQLNKYSDKDPMVFFLTRAKGSLLYIRWYGYSKNHWAPLLCKSVRPIEYIKIYQAQADASIETLRGFLDNKIGKNRIVFK